MALNALHPIERRALIKRVIDRRRLALFIDDEFADDADHMLKKYSADIYSPDAEFPPFDEDDLQGILSFFIFEPTEQDLESLLNQKSN